MNNILYLEGKKKVWKPSRKDKFIGEFLSKTKEKETSMYLKLYILVLWN